MNWTRSDGSTTSINSSYTFKMPATNLTVTANFTDTWSGSLQAGATYTLTTVSGKIFKVTCSDTSSPYHNKTYTYLGNITLSSAGTTKIVFNTTNTIYAVNQINVTKGNLEMSIGDDCPGDFPLIERNSDYTDILIRMANSTSTATDCQLKITGTADKQFIVDGGSKDFEIYLRQEGDEQNYRARHGANSVVATNSMLAVAGGVLDLDYVTLEHQWCENTSHYSTVSVGSSDSPLEATLDHVTIQNNYDSFYGSAINLGQGTSTTPVSTFIMHDCTVQHNYSGSLKQEDLDENIGSTITGGPNNRCTLKIYDSQIIDNYTPGNHSPGIQWMSAMAAPLVLAGCNVSSNWSHHAAALMLRGKASVTSCTISNNTNVAGNGGGISYQPIRTGVFISPEDFHPDVATFVLDAATILEGNHAVNGGGIFCNMRPALSGNSAEPTDEEYEWTIIWAPEGEGHPYTAELHIQGATVINNTADENGGGIYISQSDDNFYPSDLYLEAGTIMGNSARFGGGVYLGNKLSVHVGTEEGTNDLYIGDNTAVCGGGIYLTDGPHQYPDPYPYEGLITPSEIGVVDMNGGYVGFMDDEEHPNTATGTDVEAVNGGGGIYINNGNLVAKGGSIAYNTSALYGGGICIKGGDIDMNGCTINNNTTAVDGGGVYVADGNIVITDATIQDNVATNGDGGGVDIEGGDITLKGAEIYGNKANNGRGGGIYSGDGTVLVQEDTANKGSYIGNALIQGSANTAKEGGGLYVEGGDVVFSNGTFYGNYASEKGGAIYVKEGATLNLRNLASIERNHVPSNGQGGGVYMNGTLNVGENADDPADTHAISAKENYVGDVWNSAYEDEIRNNVFLPSTTKFITLLSDIHESESKIGFSVTQGFCPVIYTDLSGDLERPADERHELWLYNLLGADSGLSGALFDDTQHYFVLHVRADEGPFQAKYIYLWGSWTTYVNEDPEAHLDMFPLPSGIEHHYTVEADGWHIYTKEGLAWFVSYVNGLNQQDVHDATNAFMESDVDMAGNLWVPIGGTNAFDHESGIFGDGGQYKGHFDGQGYVIYNLDCRYLNAVQKLGLFGTLEGATVENTFVDGYQFTTQFSDKMYYMGGIAGKLTENSVIRNCEARGVMSTDYCAAESYMGGLVGLVEGGSIHSSMAMPLLTGNAKYIGGLVGGLSAGHSLCNSFSNPYYLRGNNDSKIGGLVGTNKGMVDNCYVRMQGTEPETFGWFAGTNEGTIQNCYAPADKTNYLGTEGGTITGVGNYGPTTLVNGKYGFAHEDQQITPEGANAFVVNGPISNQGELGGLLATLNKWVSEAGGDYSTWTRTLGSSMNDDYPILEFDDFVSAGSKDDIFVTYRNDLNDMIDYANTNKRSRNIVNTFNFDDGQVPARWTTVDQHDTPAGQFMVSEGGSVTEWGSTANYTAYGNEGYSFFYVSTQSFDSGTTVYLVSEPFDFDGSYAYLSINYVNEHVQAGNNNGSVRIGYTPTGDIADLQEIADLGESHEWAFKRVALRTTDGGNLSGTYHIVFCFGKWGPGYYGIDNIGVEMTEYPATAEGGRIFQYRANPTAVCNELNDDVTLYIDENVGITQVEGNILRARVGVTLDNTDGSNLGGQPYDWHMFSSSLNKVPMGLVYHTNEDGYEGVSNYSILNNYSNLVANGISNENYASRLYMDPPKTTWSTENIGYFPTDTPYGTWRDQSDSRGSFDFYTFSEPFYHWINFKREGKTGLFDHWHNDETEEGMHNNIAYSNESEMENGKGYLLAVSEPSMLMADGELNNGAIFVDATCSALTGAQASLKGVNLIGNPYQSYLDADQFMNENGLNVYYILDADAKGYIARVMGGSQPAKSENYVKAYNAPAFIHPHQGFFVRVTDDKRLTFTNEMRKAEGDEHSNFRGTEVPHYPMVTMICTDGNGMNDFATVELDRPEMGGGEKLKGMRSGDASIWFHMDEKDWHVAFAPEGTTSVALRFAAYTDGAYTLRWQKANADFHYMHLIDNVTGADIDCLRESEYRFEGKTTDYTSRFRLVFGFTGVEEDEELEQPQNFAFMMGDELVVTGEGLLQVFDLTGRCIATEELHSAQSRVAMPKAAAALYVLRLTNAGSVRTQKLVVR